MTRSTTKRKGPGTLTSRTDRAALSAALYHRFEVLEATPKGLAILHALFGDRGWRTISLLVQETILERAERMLANEHWQVNDQGEITFRRLPTDPSPEQLREELFGR